MGYGNVYSHYREQNVNTMTSGELLVLLYDEVIKRLNRAKLALDNQIFDAFDADIQRAKEIIQYFDQALDMQYPISSDLSRLYDFMMYQLSRAQAGRRTELITDTLPLLIELRDTWKEADRLSRLKR